jgi:hypothetical protein
MKPFGKNYIENPISKCAHPKKVKLIQRNFRSFLFRKRLEIWISSKSHTTQRQQAAIIIQAAWRGYWQMGIYEDQKIGALTIQRWWRTQRLRRVST